MREEVGMDAAKCAGPQMPRRSTIKELLAQKAKRLRTEAAKLEALSDSLPDLISGTQSDEYLSEIIAAGLYPRISSTY